MQRVARFILFAIVSLAAALNAGDGLVITMQEEDYRTGITTTSTVYLEPNRLSIHGDDTNDSPSLVYFADESVLRIIHHHDETVRDTKLAGIRALEVDNPRVVDQVFTLAVDRMKTMNAEQLTQSEPHLMARNCQVRLEQRGTKVERSKIEYSSSSSSKTVSGHTCDEYVGRLDDETVSAVCAVTWASLGVVSDEIQILRQMPELLASRWPGAAAFVNSGNPNQNAVNRYAGVPIEETVFCNGQAQLKTTILDIDRTEVDGDIYRAPDGYTDLTCRDEGLCN